MQIPIPMQFGMLTLGLSLDAVFGWSRAVEAIIIIGAVYAFIYLLAVGAARRGK